MNALARELYEGAQETPQASEVLPVSVETGAEGVLQLGALWCLGLGGRSTRGVARG